MLMNQPVPLRWKAFRLPKRGNKAEEYEDALAANAEVGRFAVADGASESSFAGLWARLLVDGFVKPSKKPEPGSNWVEPLQKLWAHEVDGKKLAWYAENKRSQGAYATFCGFSLRASGKDGEEEWRALAIGDSCLFHVRGDHLLKAFPVQRAAEFGNRPHLLDSRSDAGEQLRKHHRKERGHWHVGDHFYLMTDALAHWFLSQFEAKRHPWKEIDRLMLAAKPQEAFAAWIESLRGSNALKNDDVTLLPIHLKHDRA